MALLIYCKSCKRLFPLSRGKCYCGKIPQQRIYYLEWWQEGKRKRKRLGDIGIYAARDAERKVALAKNTNRQTMVKVGGKSVSLSDAIDEFLRRKQTQGLTELSLQSNYTKAKIIQENLGIAELSELTREVIDRFIAKLSETRKPWTVSLIVSRLKAIVSPYVDMEIFSGIKFATPPNRTDYYSESEARRLLKWLAEHDQITYEQTYLMLLTGLRKSNVFGLKWDMISMRDRSITVIAKGRRKHVVYFDKHFAELLSQKGDREGYIWPSIRNKDAPYNRQTFSLALESAMKQAGVRRLRVHDLRHSAATLLLKKTGNLALVQKLLGHSSITQTTRYAHVMDSQLRETPNILSEIITKDTDSKTDSETS